MTTAHDRTLQALETAIRMELDGKQFYLKASEASSNELGRKLLRKLASEEDNHRQKFEEIYQAVQNKMGWPETDFRPDGGKRLRTVFATASKEIGSKLKAPANELEAIQTAMGMENKTLDFYKSQSEKATSDTEREYYEKLASEEREHHLILLDYYEYLKDPAAWFVNTEHPSLDGG